MSTDERGTGGGGAGIQPARRRDMPEIAAVLGRAFADDPVMAWLFPDPEERRRLLPGMFSVLLRRQHLRHGAVRVDRAAGGPVRGAAMWDPPGRWENARWREWCALPGYARVFGRRLPVAGEMVAALAAAHPRAPHWYLAVIGTDPVARGGGVGAALIRSRLATCDHAGLPAYLESSKESNVGYYERFGFRVTGEVRVPGGGPVNWTMWREPATG
jgi:GNAT superfamily N-acetyltransferase